MAFFESEKTSDTPEEVWGGEGGLGVSSATTDLDQKYLLQNQSQRHQYFIIGEPAGRCTSHLQPFLPVLSFPRLLFLWTTGFLKNNSIFQILLGFFFFWCLASLKADPFFFALDPVTDNMPK